MTNASFLYTNCAGRLQAAKEDGVRATRRKPRSRELSCAGGQADPQPRVTGRVLAIFSSDTRDIRLDYTDASIEVAKTLLVPVHGDWTMGAVRQSSEAHETKAQKQ